MTQEVFSENDEMVVAYVKTETPAKGIRAIVLLASFVIALLGGVYLWFILISTSFDPVNVVEFSAVIITTSIAIIIGIILMGDGKRKMMVAKKHLKEVKE